MCLVTQDTFLPGPSTGQPPWPRAPFKKALGSPSARASRPRDMTTRPHRRSADHHTSAVSGRSRPFPALTWAADHIAAIPDSFAVCRGDLSVGYQVSRIVSVFAGSRSCISATSSGGDQIDRVITRRRDRLHRRCAVGFGRAGGDVLGNTATSGRRHQLGPGVLLLVCRFSAPWSAPFLGAKETFGQASGEGHRPRQSAGIPPRSRRIRGATSSP